MCVEAHTAACIAKTHLQDLHLLQDTDGRGAHSITAVPAHAVNTNKLNDCHVHMFASMHGQLAGALQTHALVAREGLLVQQSHLGTALGQEMGAHGARGASTDNYSCDNEVDLSQ